ncbi:hypothetical protein HPB51_009569 [Rhipicephalus microplus]|uniref:Uncharacterized protein n=1 Tax=Rhipicephalus microplus TaxID=6941 RepID=A0A9J6D975_RHIMP|nr:hypothetical protein HPB51_009569 [Rhipicephalus microplus]
MVSQRGRERHFMAAAGWVRDMRGPNRVGRTATGEHSQATTIVDGTRRRLPPCSCPGDDRRSLGALRRNKRFAPASIRPARSHAELGPCPHWAWRVVVRNGGTFGKVCLIGRVERLCDVLLSRMSQPVAAVTFAQSRGQCPVDGEPWVDAAVSGASPHLVDRAFRPHSALTGRPQRGPGSHSRAAR